LIVGIPGASNAIKIAERLGLDGELIGAANSHIGSDRRQFENILLSAERARKNALLYFEESERARSEAEKTLSEIKSEKEKFLRERESFRQTVKSQTKILIENSAEEAGEIIDEMKRLLKERDEAALFEARRLKRRIENLGEKAKPEPHEEKDDEIIRVDGEIRCGDSVYVESLRAKGEAVEVFKDEVLVKIGDMKTHVKHADLYRIKPDEKSARKKPSIGVGKPINLEAAPSEINLIGKNIDESLYLLDNFIDRAVTCGLGEVRIIHGVGTGKLGRAVQGYLSGHKNIAEYRFGRYGEGERGVTVAKLK
jgi:DNA mismatch repair protein MutS2